jgi:hypothetical protein
VESGVASGVVAGRVVAIGVVAVTLGVVVITLGVVVVTLGVVTVISCNVTVDDVYGTITGGKVVKGNVVT